MHLSNICCAIISRWDNGETEKLSPWDVEPIGDDGESLQHMLHLKKAFPIFLGQLKKCICVVIQTHNQRWKVAGFLSHLRR